MEKGILRYTHSLFLMIGVLAAVSFGIYYYREKAAGAKWSKLLYWYIILVTVLNTVFGILLIRETGLHMISYVFCLSLALYFVSACIFAISARGDSGLFS